MSDLYYACKKGRPDNAVYGTCRHEACRPEGPVSAELLQLFPDAEPPGAQEQTDFASPAEAAEVVAACTRRIATLGRAVEAAQHSISCWQRSLERDAAELDGLSRECASAIAFITRSTAP
ncbi:hypothetical protein ACH4FX_12125 [Streptomyces sp. NPDC018019]|uniref:hypothetical protein n=1 Tax=Streptomyces sp. NPDC018019 TaxID=3365030 RepID=UPI003797376D